MPEVVRYIDALVDPEGKPIPAIYPLMVSPSGSLIRHRAIPITVHDEQRDGTLVPRESTWDPPVVAWTVFAVNDVGYHRVRVGQTRWRSPK